MRTLQSLRGYSRQELVKGDVCELLFRHRKTQEACRVFVAWLKEKEGEATPREMSQFAWDLQEGRVKSGFTYQRRVFYGVVLKTLMTLGFVGKTMRYRKGVVYVPILQPIPRRAPLLGTWWGFAYMVAERWNQSI